MGRPWVRRVLVVDDQAALRTLVCDMLNRHGWETAGAADAEQALHLFEEFDPDALLTDIDLGTRPNGAELAAMLYRLAPHLGIVFLSSYPRAAAGAKVMGVPAAVFLGKDALGSPDDLLAALEEAMSRPTNPEPDKAPASDKDGLAGLTRHQIDLLSMVSRGWSNEQIAEASGTSVRAVERAISRIFGRLEIGGDPRLNPRVAAAARYIAAFGPSR